MSEQTDIRIGDKYHRTDKGAFVEITGVTETHVTWQVFHGEDKWSQTETIEDFRKLEANSLRWGAVFEPAPDAQPISHTGENAGLTTSK